MPLFRSMIDPVISQIGKYDIATIDRSGQQISILHDEARVSLLKLVSSGGRSSIILYKPDAKHVILEGQTAVITPIWHRLAKQVLSRRMPSLEGRRASLMTIAVTMVSAIVMAAGIYLFMVERGVSASAVAGAQAARLANLKKAENLLRELQSSHDDNSNAPVSIAKKTESAGAYRASAGTDRYGIQDVPPVDSWADKSRITLPLPGGGTIRQPEDMMSFGLRP